MSSPLTATTILDQEYLEIRAKILQLAAAFDRVDRGAERDQIADDPRLHKLLEAIDVLRSAKVDRAEQVQMVFSLAYEADWPERLGVALGDS